MSTPQQSQQLAMHALLDANKHTLAARQHLEAISPLMKNSSVYEQLVKLSKTISELMLKVGGLKL